MTLEQSCLHRSGRDDLSETTFYLTGLKAKSMQKIPTILVVDDEVRNIRLLKAMLAPEKYHIISALNGEEALEKVRGIKLDLVLLDVMMPGMDGLEVCRKIKRVPENQSVPIVMVTALTAKEDRIRAMEAGSDDFLSKPIDKTELLVRVKSMLRIRSYHDQVSTHLHEIKEKNEKLSQLEKMKEELMHMIVHDLKNPLTNFTIGLEMLMDEKGELPDDVYDDTLEALLVSSRDLNAMVQNILDVYKMEEEKIDPAKEQTNLVDLTNEVVQLFGLKIREKEVQLSVSNPEEMPPLWIDTYLIKRVMANLLNNAIKHTPKGGEIKIRIDDHSLKDYVCCSITDSGSGLPPEYHEMIFDKFEQVNIKLSSVRIRGHGLGLAFCKMAVEAHQGRIWLESDGEGRGCTFRFTLPLVLEGAVSDNTSKALRVDYGRENGTDH